MKCLFCYDGPLEVDFDGKYYGTVINDKVFHRYEILADEIKVAIRVVKTSHPDEKSLIRSNHVKIHAIENISSISGQFKKKSVILELTELIKTVDFLIIRLPSFIGNECEKIARKINKPYIVEIVGCPWDSLWNYNIKGKVVAPIMWMQTKKKVYNASHVIYVTNQFLQERYPTKGKYACCSNVEIPDNVTENLEKIARYKNITKSDTIILGTSAAVNVPYKGQECVLRAIPKLLAKGIKVRYEMVGGGDKTYLQNIAKQLDIEDYVVFKGLLAHENVFKWLRQVDIYIQPSKQEGLPRALIEAMNATCFCIGSDTGGIPELLPKHLIFSNRRDNYVEIANLIINNLNVMQDEAKRNYRESLKYEKTKIQRNRENLFKEFAEEKLWKR